MNDKKMKVAVGMSGGVDSSVAAKILVDQGHEVIGFMMKFWADESCLRTRDNACCDPQSVEDAKRVARKVGIPFYVIDCREEFKKAVTDYFTEEYRHHRTPNPCVVCNEKIKFGWFLDMAKSVGCDYVATGHYARIKNNSSKSKVQSRKSKEEQAYRLLKGVDDKKDQSYFLHRLNQDQLSHILLPLGELTKDEVRKMAKKWKLPVGEKKESQEVCFIGDKDYRDFLRRQLPAREFKPGNIVNKVGEIVGYHMGLLNYTIGQRKGIDQTVSNKLKVKSPKSKADEQEQGCIISSKSLSLNHSDKQPLYVLGVNAEKNELIVGDDTDLYQLGAKIVNYKLINPVDLKKIRGLSIKIRYRSQPVGCKIKSVDKEEINIIFDSPQRAVTPGQSAVIYYGEELLGGGIIS